MPDPIYNFWQDLKFRKTLFFGVCSVCLVLASVAILSLPQVYRIEAWLLLQTPNTTVFAPGNPSTRPAEELEIVERHLLSQATLQRAAGMIDVADETSIEEQAQALRPAIQTRRLIGGNRASLLHLTVTHPDQAVARELSTFLVAEVLDFDVNRQSERAALMVSFAQTAATRSHARLDAVDAQILDLRQTAATALPDTLQARLVQKADIEDQLRAIAHDLIAEQTTPTEPKILEAENVALLLERTVQERARTARYAPEGSDRLKAVDTRLASLRARLATLRAADVADPPRIALLQAQQQDLQQSLAQLNTSLAATPSNAARMEALQRSRQQLEAEFTATQTALASARSWQDALAAGVAQRWSVADIPFTSGHPQGPRRSVLGMAAVVMSGAAGVIAVVAAGLLDGRIRSPQHVAEVLGEAPMFEVARLSPVALYDHTGSAA